jgi:hypothetical protein
MGTKYLSFYWDITEEISNEYLLIGSKTGTLDMGNQGDYTWFIGNINKQDNYRLWYTKYNDSRYIYIIDVFDSENNNYAFSKIEKMIGKQTFESVGITNMFIIQTDKFEQIQNDDDNFTITVIDTN